MRNDRPIEEWLRDIVRWGEKLARHIDRMDEETFLADEKTQDAVAKCAEAIGNAGKEILEIEPEFDRKHPGANLAKAYASRIRLAHKYFSIDYSVLWNTASRFVPATVEAVKLALENRLSDDHDGGNGADGGACGGPI